MVSAPIMIKGKGHRARRGQARQDRRLRQPHIQLTVKTDNRLQLGGRHGVLRQQATLHPDQGINLDGDVGTNMVYISNTDVPGMIGFIRYDAGCPPASTSPTSSSAPASGAAT